ncbi:hypothetical protein VCHA38O209_20294 [Vibrio chagasii]|nr:hypothetical protein VCHA38O209_20294 [Vibrio chagasii]
MLGWIKGGRKVDLYSSFSVYYLRPIFTTTQITALLTLLYSLTLEHIRKRTQGTLTSLRVTPPPAL